MKQILLFTFFSFLACTVVAQNFEVNPNPALFEVEDADLSDSDYEPVNHATFINNTSGEVSLRWERTIVFAPEGWEFPVCDNNQCYFPQVDTAPIAFIVDGNGGESILDVHALPNGVAGCAQVELKVTPFSNPDNVLLTAVYDFKVNNPGECVSSSNNINVSKVRVYPNPTTDLFKISDLENIPEADQVAVYNLVGKQVRTFAVNPGGNYNVADLPNGLYLVSLISEKEGVLKTVRMNKISTL